MAATVSAAARFKFIFFIPPSALAACKAAIFAAGAGLLVATGQYRKPTRNPSFPAGCHTPTGNTAADLRQELQ
jgi:hypothetical protein